MSDSDGYFDIYVPGCNSHFVFANWVYFYVMYGRNWKKDEFVCIDHLYYTDEIEKR